MARQPWSVCKICRLPHSVVNLQNFWMPYSWEWRTHLIWSTHVICLIVISEIIQERGYGSRECMIFAGGGKLWTVNVWKKFEIAFKFISSPTPEVFYLSIHKFFSPPCFEKLVLSHCNKSFQSPLSCFLRGYGLNWRNWLITSINQPSFNSLHYFFYRWKIMALNCLITKIQKYPLNGI